MICYKNCNNFSVELVDTNDKFALKIMDLLLKWDSMIIFVGKRRVGGDTAGNRAVPTPFFSAGAPQQAQKIAGNSA